MATDLSAQLTFLELAKRTNNSKVVDIAEVLDEANPIFKDAVWKEANGLTRNVITRRAALPSGSLRQANYGIAPEASQTEQVEEKISYWEARSEIDEMIVKLAGDAAEQKKFRYDEDISFVSGLGQTFIESLLYGNLDSIDSKDLIGLAARYNNPSTQTNVFDEGHTVDDVCTSVWFIKWGSDAMYLCYPKGSKTVGVEQNDKGLELITSATNYRFYAWVTQFILNAGICIRNHQAVQRIGSIEAAGTTNGFDEDNGIKALNNIEEAFGNLNSVVMYVNKDVKNQIDILAKDKSNVNYSVQEAFGKSTTVFRDVVPVRLLPGISSTEDDI